MKCNMCEEADMEHKFAITNKNTQEVTVLSNEHEAYFDMQQHVRTVNSGHTADGHRITHIYNCEECPNSQLEFYQHEDAQAYVKVMTGTANYYL